MPLLRRRTGPTSMQPVASIACLFSAEQYRFELLHEVYHGSFPADPVCTTLYIPLGLFTSSSRSLRASTSSMQPNISALAFGGSPHLVHSNGSGSSDHVNGT